MVLIIWSESIRSTGSNGLLSQEASSRRDQLRSTARAQTQTSFMCPGKSKRTRTAGFVYAIATPSRSSNTVLPDDPHTDLLKYDCRRHGQSSQLLRLKAPRPTLRTATLVDHAFERWSTARSRRAR